MSNIILGSGPSGSGSLTLQAPNTNGVQTVNFPDASGVPMVSGNMPTFFAYNSGSSQNISANTLTKATLNATEFNTSSAFDTTNSKFLPTVAGYYQIDASIYFNYGGSAPSWMDLYVYKNGASVRWARTLLSWGVVTTSSVIYLNGTTDYVELYGYVQTNAGQIIASQSGTYLSGSLVRTA
jgi:hypothetical protein